MTQYILTIDQGTTGTTASIINSVGTIIASSDQDFEQIFPKPGWVEHNPEHIWSTVEHTVFQVIKKAQINSDQIIAIGITNQRETTVAWDKQTGKPFYNAIVWQCRRTADVCLSLKKKGYEKKIKIKTGLVLDPYFSASKMQWILKHSAEARAAAKQNRLAFGTMDSFLIWKLSGGVKHVTDVSNASRTMLLNIKSCQWDNELLKIFSIPLAALPEVKESSGELAETKGLKFLPNGIKISGVAGDQQSALFGQSCFQAGEAKCTFGTGSFLLMNTGHQLKFSKNGLLTTVAWKLKNQKTQYALEGGAFICGAAVQWLKDNLGIITLSSDVEPLANSVPSTDGVYFVPALSGLSAPYWDPHARGIIFGLTRGSTKAHIARAALEAMAFQNVELLLCMSKDLGKKIKSLKVDGGATANHLLMQMQADFLGTDVVRPEQIETTSLGAAFLAGLGVGFWKSTKDIQKLTAKNAAYFSPKLNLQERKKQIVLWQKAVQKTRAIK